jgi:hypothetical protein
MLPDMFWVTGNVIIGITLMLSDMFWVTGNVIIGITLMLPDMFWVTGNEPHNHDNVSRMIYRNSYTVVMKRRLILY